LEFLLAKPIYGIRNAHLWSSLIVELEIKRETSRFNMPKPPLIPNPWPKPAVPTEQPVTSRYNIAKTSRRRQTGLNQTRIRLAEVKGRKRKENKRKDLQPRQHKIRGEQSRRRGTVSD
jgi:hypothetical protein